MTLIFTAILFEFDLLNISEKYNQLTNEPNIDEKMRKGFNELESCLNKYFEISNITYTEKCKIRIFGSVTLKNGAILRAINEFHDRPWFSNVAIAMNDEELFEYQSDSGICYAQVFTLIFFFYSKCYNNYNLKYSNINF